MCLLPFELFKGIIDFKSVFFHVIITDIDFLLGLVIALMNLFVLVIILAFLPILILILIFFEASFVIL